MLCAWLNFRPIIASLTNLRSQWLWKLIRASTPTFSQLSLISSFQIFGLLWFLNIRIELTFLGLISLFPVCVVLGILNWLFFHPYRAMEMKSLDELTQALSLGGEKDEKGENAWCFLYVVFILERWIISFWLPDWDIPNASEAPVQQETQVHTENKGTTANLHYEMQPIIAYFASRLLQISVGNFYHAQLLGYCRVLPA